MKVLYMTMMYPVPKYTQKGIFCHEQVKALIQIGAEVDVVVPLPFYDKEYETKYWTFEGVRIQYVKYFKIPGTTGFQHIGKSLYFALNQSEIDFRCYDILHADAPLPAGDAVRLISRKYQIPYVIHGHGLDVFFTNSYNGARNCNKIANVCTRVYRDANAIVGVSQKVLDCIQKRVDISSKGFVVYNGVDTERFIPVEHENSRIELISIGNLIPLKGHDYTIRAVKRIVDEGEFKIHLRILGRGEKEEELNALVRKLELEKYVEFMGYVPYNEVVKALQESDIFVLPSYYEALGCVYLEAMACGLPAIGCRGNGIDEIIQNGKDGYLIPEKNVESIMDSIKELAIGTRYKAMGKLARKHMEEKYRWIDSAKSLMNLYKEIIG